MNLKMAVLYNTCFINPFKYMVSFSEILFNISYLFTCISQYIIRLFLMNHRCTGQHCLLRVKYEGKYLILHLNQLKSLFRCQCIGSHNSCNTVTYIPGFVCKYQPVRRIPVPRIQGPGMACSCIFQLRQILMGNYSLYPGQSLCLACIDAFYNCMGIRASQHLPHKHIPFEKVIGILRPACHFGKRIFSNRSFPHYFESHFSTFNHSDFS